MSDGSLWEAGSFGLGGSGNWQRVAFAEPFRKPPHLFLSVQTDNDPDPVAVRARDVDETGFSAALLEKGRLLDGHGFERVGYLAIHSPAESGLLEEGGPRVPYLLQRLDVDARWAPVLSQGLRSQEEQSKDAETAHVAERIDVLALDDQL